MFKKITLFCESQYVRSIEKKSKGKLIGIFPKDHNKLNKESYDEIEKLLEKGWEIVSTTPLQGTVLAIGEKDTQIPFSVTSGILVFMVKK